MAAFDMRGAWTALVTPFNEDCSVDWAGFKKNIDFQIEQGISGILPMGTTGESPTLDWKEHDLVIEKGIEYAGGKVPVIAGVGSNNSTEAVRAAQHAEKAGADLGLLVDCYYNGPSSLELRKHYYEYVAEKVPGLPLVPYVIPGRSGCELSLEDVAILSGNPQFAAVKEATGNLDRMRRERELVAEGFSIMSGDDDITGKIMTDPAIKADGVISVMTNICPGPIVKMVACFHKGDTEGGLEWEAKLKPLLGLVTVKVENEREIGGRTFKVTDKFRNPMAIKIMMAGLGMPSGRTRHPLGKMTKNAVEIVRGTLRKVWDETPELLRPIADFYAVDVATRLADDDVWSALAY